MSGNSDNIAQVLSSVIKCKCQNIDVIREKYHINYINWKILYYMQKLIVTNCTAESAFTTALCVCLIAQLVT